MKTSKKLRKILNVADTDTLPVPEPFKGATNKMYAVVVCGESLTGTGIESGDSVIIKATKLKPEAYIGEIVHASVDGKHTVKRLGIGKGTFVLMPENSEYKPYYIQPDEKFRIMGVAIAVQKPLYNPPF